MSELRIKPKYCSTELWVWYSCPHALYSVAGSTGLYYVLPIYACDLHLPSLAGKVSSLPNQLWALSVALNFKCSEQYPLKQLSRASQREVPGSSCHGNVVGPTNKGFVYLKLLLLIQLGIMRESHYWLSWQVSDQYHFASSINLCYLWKEDSLNTQKELSASWTFQLLLFLISVPRKSEFLYK